MIKNKYIIHEIFSGTWSIDNFLTTEECKAIINLVESFDFQKACQSNVGRNNLEVNFENRTLYDTLMNKINNYAFAFGDCLFSLNKFFPVFAAFKYSEGDFITPHADAPIDIGDEKTAITFLIYLNDNFTGGETFFNYEDRGIFPATGKALFFLQEKFMLHEAKPVIEGVKYILRLDCYIQN